jgi:hypothetical protein
VAFEYFSVTSVAAALSISAFWERVTGILCYAERFGNLAVNFGKTAPIGYPKSVGGLK